MKTAALSLLPIICSSASAFSPPAPVRQRTIFQPCIYAAASTDPPRGDDDAMPLASATVTMPLTYDEMMRQASQCISDAYDLGIYRQIVRILLPRNVKCHTTLGELIEEKADPADRTKIDEVRLVPPDESWQGGIMQLYRATCPAAEELLRRASPSFRDAGVPPRILEDRSVDESGADGVGICYTQSGTRSDTTENSSNGAGGFFGGGAALPSLSENDNCIFVQPNQEVIDSIDKLSSKSYPSSLIALLNPQWRDVDDALDSASKDDGVFGSIASFLGGKGSALRRLDELGYVPTYTLEGYVCKGTNVRLLGRFDTEWTAFAERDKERGEYASEYVELGSMKERPSYQDVEAMLDERGISNKYARDLGMAPKL